MSEPNHPGAPPRLPLDVLGGELHVPTVQGTSVRYANLDYAASAPCLVQVRDVVDELLPWYSSVHRGAGFPSSVCTDILAGARETLRAFLRARPDDTVVFTRNTTDSLNLLARSLVPDTTVIAFASEHHANLLPWRSHDLVQLPVSTSPEGAIASVEAALRATPPGRRCLLALTGASNVTGEVWPVTELTRLAHHFGARVVLDAAQLAPHRPIDVTASGVDYVALSGHKLYAPFGAGVLAGRPDWLDEAPPYLAGGGAVRRVTLDDTTWASGPARHEAGTPNLVGVVALATACQTLRAVGMHHVADREAALVDGLLDGLGDVPGLDVVTAWGPESERIGVVTFTLRGWHHGRLAAVLSAEYGIGVRDGAFCAHPFVDALLAASDDGRSGAVRASFGAGTDADDLERLVTALQAVARHGTRWTYAEVDGRYVPEPDPRPRPPIHRRFAAAGASSAAPVCGGARAEPHAIPA